jgi:uncharacterized protein YcfJ
MNKLMLASITVAAILAISAVAPMATADKPQKEFDYHKVVVDMIGEITSAPLDNFKAPENENQQLMQAAWVDFAQVVQATPPDAIVDNSVICAAIDLYVWPWNGLYGNLKSTALCA